MPKIVGVHGVGQQFKGKNTLRQAWLPALQDGLDRVDRALTSETDFHCAFYGDFFRPEGKSALDPPYVATDVDDPWEQELLERWWREAASIDTTILGPGAQTKASVPNFVQDALNALSYSRFFAGLTERALIYDLKQMRRYLQEPELRRQIRARVEQVINPDTRVVIGHSLGSVVAYEALCAHPEWPVTMFVTLGSPLGIRNLIFDRLEPLPDNGRGVWPAGIKHWVNIADRGDIVALVKTLSSCFGARVKDCLVNNGSQAHDVTFYLTTREVGDAIARGLSPG